MKESSRRAVLRSMAGASMLPALSFLKNSPMSIEISAGEEKTGSVKPLQTLAVVFHGLFAFIFGAPGKQIDVVAPVVTGHIYWAGNFGQEDENVIQEGDTLQLNGMKPGSWIPKYDFPFLRNVAAPPDPKQIYCQVSLPWPDALMFDRQVAPINGQKFFNSPSSLNPAQFPAIFVFLYHDQTIVSRPMLKGTHWVAPRTMGIPGRKVNANLHIRAEHCNSSVIVGWDVLSDLFELTGNQRVALNSKYTKIGAPTGIGTFVPASEDDFLIEEPQCAKLRHVKDSPTNCASIGICKPGQVCS